MSVSTSPEFQPSQSNSFDAASADEAGIAYTTRRALTVEMLLYAAVFGLAIFLRLFRLGIAPLSEGEAAQAMSALRGETLVAGGSPLLYGVNAFLMSMFSASDALVRLMSALIGSAIVLSPALFRDALGRMGALGAALILALSPVELVASRSLDDEVMVVACALALVAFVRRYLATRDGRSLVGAGAALGIGLASGSGMYTALAAMGAGLLMLRFTSGSSRRPSWRSVLFAPDRNKAVLALAIAFLLAATGGLLYLSGLGSAGDLLTTWLGAFASGAGSSTFDLLQILIVYDALALVVGLFGLGRVVAARRVATRQAEEDIQPESDETEASSDAYRLDAAATAPMRDEEGAAPLFGLWLGFTAMAALAIIFLQPGRQPIDLLLPVTLLALLAAYAIQAWAETMRAQASVEVDGVIVPVGLAVTAFLALNLTSFVRGRIPAAALGGAAQGELGLLVLFGLVLGLVGGLLVMMYNLRAALRAGASLGLLILTLASFSAGWGATQVRVDDAHEIIRGSRVTTTGVRLLLETAEQIAIRTQGHTGTLPIQIDVDDPVVAWYLQGAQVTADSLPAGIVTPFGQQPQAVSGGYIGARFNIRQAWDTVGLNLDTWLEWALFRESSGQPPLDVQSVTLWEKR